MDKLTKLQKLLGDMSITDAVDDTNPVDWSYKPPKNMHIYEGTDSDDDEVKIIPIVEPSKKKSKTLNVGAPSNIVGPQSLIRRPENLTVARQYSLQLGELAEESETFCPWRAVKDYPWKFVGTGNRDKVVHAFYENESYADEHWDFFYLHRGTTDLNQQPFILVPTHQVQSFFATINEALGINLTIPSGGSNAGFHLQFDNDGCPRPRYLGKSTSAEMAQDLHRNIPPSYFKLDGEPDAMGNPSERSLAAFKRKMDDMMNLQKHKKAANAEKRKKERFQRQAEWCHSLKRVQRYLGLRKVKDVDQDEINSELNLYGGRFKGDLEAAVKKAIAKLGPCASFDAEKVAPYENEADVVFVCVDVEAYERDSKLITEIGIATLDTRDLKDVVPGKGGKEWMSKIRARHFRIKEHAHLHNTEFVQGCADRFDFGESEFISLKDAPKVIGSCFKYPYSDPKATEGTEEDEKRQIILLGHDTPADIAFMQKMGYNVHNLSSLREVADTAGMWRYVKREPNPRSLGLILYELDIVGWNLHNAGNDAALTLQAMIGIAIKHIEDKQNVDKEKVKKSRISDTIREATEVALEKEEGWSSSGENSDGGAPISQKPAAPPVRAHVPGTSKQAIYRANNPPPAPVAAAFQAALPVRTASQASNWGEWMNAPASSQQVRQGVPTPNASNWGPSNIGTSQQHARMTDPSPSAASSGSRTSSSRNSTKSQSLQAGMGNMSYQDRKARDEQKPAWDEHSDW